VLTTNDRTLRAWNARNLHGAREWHLPDAVPYQKSVWGAVPVRRATSCGVASSAIVAGTDEEMFAVFRAGAEAKDPRTPETLINDLEYHGAGLNGPCIAVRMDGGEALLSTTHVSRIVRLSELTRGVVPLRKGTMYCEERAQHTAVSLGLKTIVLLDSPSVAVLLRSRLIDVVPDLESGLKAIRNWR